MSLSRNALNAVIAGAFAISLAGAATTASFAADASKEKCYGVAKAGQNDCASTGKTHSCAGQSKVDGAGDEFLLLPNGVCAKLVGGSTVVSDASMTPDAMDSMGK